MGKHLAVVALLLGLLVPSLAEAGANTGRCRRLAKQVHHYQGVEQIASERGDALWTQHRGQISRLQHRLYSLCPEYKPSGFRKFQKFMADATRAAAMAARKYYTGGW